MLYLRGYLHCVVDDFRVRREECAHLFFGFEVFLLGVAQPLRVINVGIGCEADEPVVRRTVFLSEKVNVVGGYHLDVLFFCKRENGFVDLLLKIVDFKTEPGNFSLVQHHLKVIVFAKNPFEPVYCLPCLVQIT